MNAGDIIPATRNGIARAIASSIMSDTERYAITPDSEARWAQLIENGITLSANIERRNLWPFWRRRAA